MTETGSSYTDRIIISLAKRKNLDRVALRSLMKANELLGLAIGVRIAEIRDSGEPLQEAFAESEVQALQARAFEEICQILGQRWDKIPDLRRPQYTPQLRFRILRLKRLPALSNEETARYFRVSDGTISRWEKEVAATSSADTRTVGSLVKPEPPVRRYSDVVRQLVQTMPLAGFGGNARIAQTLARAGWKLPKRTVGRILKEKPPENPVTDKTTQKKPRVLTAKHPNHIFLLDITEIPSLFGIFTFKLAVVLDVFSRMPIIARVFAKEPTTDEMAQLMKKVSSKDHPRHFVSDQGSQFTADYFKNTLKELGIKQRFGAIGKTGSIALIERLWRTLKDFLKLHSLKPLVHKQLERRLELGLLYYAFFKPHQGLKGATPAEIYFGQQPAHTLATAPPRGRPGEGSTSPPFEIFYLDPECLLPVLEAKAA